MFLKNNCGITQYHKNNQSKYYIKEFMKIKYMSLILLSSVFLLNNIYSMELNLGKNDLKLIEILNRIDFKQDWNSIIDLIYNERVDVNTRDKNGISALMHAAYYGCTNIVRLLINHGADINISNYNYKNTALMYAVEKGHKDIVELLIASGADVNAKNNNCDTALIWAVQKGYIDIVEMLIAAGADTTAKDEYGYNTALMYAINYNYRDIVTLFITLGLKS